MEKFGLDFNPSGQIFWQLSVYWTFKEDANLLIAFSGTGSKRGFILIGRDNIAVNARS
jgi:hypothetical protein